MSNSRFKDKSVVAFAIEEISAYGTAADYRNYIAEACRRGGFHRAMAVCDAVREWEDHQIREHGYEGVRAVRQMRRQAEALLREAK